MEKLFVLFILVLLNKYLLNESTAFLFTSWQEAFSDLGAPLAPLCAPALISRHAVRHSTQKHLIGLAKDQCCHLRSGNGPFVSRRLSFCLRKMVH